MGEKIESIAELGASMRRRGCWLAGFLFEGGPGLLDNGHAAGLSEKVGLMTALIVAKQARLWRILSRFVQVTPVASKQAPAHTMAGA
jgi:hypothetical protein